MNSLLMRTGSMPVLGRFIPDGSSSQKVTPLSRHSSIESLPSYDDRFAGKISIDAKDTNGMRRVLSESDVVRSARKMKNAGSMASPVKIPGRDIAKEITFSDGWRSLSWKEKCIPLEDQGFSDGGGGSGYSGGGKGKRKGNRGGGYGDQSKLGDYYREMLKSNPNNSLLLMNYGKFLYEVEKDSKKAEEYYGRAILENPGDGEALSMYGKLIWETKRDEKRAELYFNQAVDASPNDCMVLGSYASFMWETEDEGEEMVASSSPMVSAV